MAKPKTYTVSKLLKLTTEQAETLHAYRHDNRIASENDAIRKLIGEGLIFPMAMQTAMAALNLATSLAQDNADMPPEKVAELENLWIDFAGIYSAESMAFDSAGPERETAEILVPDFRAKAVQGK